ncbi:MAG: methyltransferase domain-containing protein [Candidatus Kerfeldbacteria bacterium]|jgi:ubiquinone/menaquinone biosynthesis C-methylase UbiE
MNTKHWDQLHDNYTKVDWIDTPTEFSQWVIKHLSPNGKLLDIGGGQGQDSRFFADKGYNVTLLDISPRGLELAKEKTSKKLQKNLSFYQHDISKLLPFSDSSFDFVYTHLAIHYFNKKTTKQIFDEMYRILKKDGIIAIFTNSINDPEYNTGVKIEKDFFEISGVRKRYFSIETMIEFTKGFDTIAIDEKGSTPKDRAVNTNNLIRYIGKK